MLHPAATSGTLFADPGLVGEWAATEPLQVRAAVAAASSDAKGPSYTASLTVYDKGELKTEMTLELMLTDVGSIRVADLFLARPDRDKLVGMYGFLAIPVHQVMKTDRDGDTLTVRPFRGDWLASHTDGGAVTHDRVAVGGGEVVMVTAPTERLRDLLVRHADDPRAFGDPIVFHRIKN
jgi:hypothetical protein